MPARHISTWQRRSRELAGLLLEMLNEPTLFSAPDSLEAISQMGSGRARRSVVPSARTTVKERRFSAA